MKQTLQSYSLHFNNVPIRDNTNAISLSKNPFQHSRTKHIELRHHFIRDYMQKCDISIEMFGTFHQLVDILTKPSNEDRFCTIRR